jgi:hypothetical protein
MLTTWHPLCAEVGSNFADKRRSLGIVHSWTKATELFLPPYFSLCYWQNSSVKYAHCYKLLLCSEKFHSKEINVLNCKLYFKGKSIFTDTRMQRYGCFILTVDCIMIKDTTDWFITTWKDLTDCHEQLFMYYEVILCVI